MDNQEFEALNIEEQIRIFSVSPITEKGDLILRSQEPDKLTRSLASEELYLILKEMDQDERAELIKFATLDQLFFITDIECWKKDRIDGAAFVRWLETLQLSDERRLYSWLMEMDYETVVAGLQKFVTILKPEWEYAADDLLGDSPYFTIDMLYYIMVEEENLDTVRRAFELLFENHRGRYTAILEGILSEGQDSLEEEAYRRREIRLSDRGFPDYETSMRAYVPLDKKGFESFEIKKKNYFVKPAGENASQTPNYLVLWGLTPLFLDKVLHILGEKDIEAQDGVYEELAWLSNKLVVCHGMDFTSEGKVRANVERARSFLSMGLEILSDADVDEAVEILRTRWIETVFRFAVGRLYKLRDDAHSIVRNNWGGARDNFLEFMDPPFEFIVRGVLERIPLAYDFTVTENVYYHREFQSREDLRRAELALEQISETHRFLNEKTPDSFRKTQKALSLGDSACTFTPVLGTVYASFVLGGVLDSSPLSISEIRNFLKKGFENRAGVLFLREDIKEDFWARFFSAENRTLVTPVWGLVFQRFQEQMSRMDPEAEIESYLLTCLLVKPAKAKAAKKSAEKKPQKKK